MKLDTYAGTPLDWIRRVPSDWKVRRFKYTASESKQKCGLVEDPPQMLSVSGYRGVILKEYEDENQKRSAEDLTTYLVVKPDQLVLNTMWLNYCGLGVSRDHGLVSPAYRSYDLGPEWYPPFIHHLSRSETFVWEYTRLGYGIRPNSLQVSREDFASLAFPCPPLPSQKAIADFLDRKTAAIDAVIEKKQKLLDLLAEKRAALINQAVTKGLDPNVPMKDSGIPWIGEIPAHWQLVRSKCVFRLFGGYAFPGDEFVGDSTEVDLPILLTPGNFHRDGGLYFSESNTVRFSGRAPARFRLREGDLVAVLTDLSYRRLILGRAAVVKQDGLFLNQRTARIDINHRFVGRVSEPYLEVVLSADAVRAQVLSTSRGSTVFHTSPDRMLESRWPLPPRTEQAAIVQHVHQSGQRLEKAAVATAFQIERLQEYRQALITAAVIGQLDIGEEEST